MAHQQVHQLGAIGLRQLQSGSLHRLGIGLPRTRFSGKNSHQVVVALELLSPMARRLQQSIEIQPQLLVGQGLQNVECGDFLLLIQQPLQGWKHLSTTDMSTTFHTNQGP